MNSPEEEDEELYEEFDKVLTLEHPPFVVCDYVPEGFVLSKTTDAESFALLRSENVNSDCDLVIGDVIELSYSTTILDPPVVYGDKFITREAEEAIGEQDKKERLTKTIYGVKDQYGQLITTNGRVPIEIVYEGKEANVMENLGIGIPFAFEVPVANKRTQVSDYWMTLPHSVSIKKPIFNLRCESVLENPYPTRSEKAAGAHLVRRHRCRLEAHRLLLGKYFEAFKNSEELDFQSFEDKECRWNKSAYKGICQFGEGLPRGYAVDAVIEIKNPDIAVQTLKNGKKILQALAKITRVGDTWFEFRADEVYEEQCALMYGENRMQLFNGIKCTIRLMEPEYDELVAYIDRKLEANLARYAEENNEEKIGAAERGLRLLRHTGNAKRFKPKVIREDDKLKVGDEVKRLDIEQRRTIDTLAFHKSPPRFSVLTACPGTGKTLCAAATIQANVLKEGGKEKGDEPKKVQMVLAMTNYAVDNMAAALHKIGGLRVLRIYSISATRKRTAQEPEYGLNAIIAKMISDLPSSPKSLTPTQKTLWEYMRNEMALSHFEQRGVTAHQEKEFILRKMQQRTLTSEIYSIVMKQYNPDVILTTADSYLRYRIKRTLSTLAPSKHRNQKILKQVDGITGKAYYNPFEVFFEDRTVSRLVVEEASQLDLAHFTALMAVNRDTEQIVLIGDPKQMPPFYSVTNDTRLRKYGGQSVLNMLLRNKNCANFTLSIGYRSHPDLQKLTALFYGNLKRKDFPGSRRRWKKHPDAKWNIWGRPNQRWRGPLQFRLISGKSAKTNAFSRNNELEAHVALNLILKALACGVLAKNIGVICLYAGQAALMRSKLMNGGVFYEDIEVATVDSFQGREKHYIILLTTRTKGPIEGEWSKFITDERRMNVATSRAIHGMIIIGSCWMKRAWPMVYQYCYTNKLIYKDL
ncbi:hypothetical protein QR680_018736 [Steinernema hermaphroditum]|nr:hypothetical protein QR680_018736 [Steinernema hermaphroditum]